MTKLPTLPLEDELGDVLDKAMRRAGLTPELLAARTGVSLGRICDAVDYRSDLCGDELRRIAGAGAQRSRFVRARLRPVSQA